MTVPQYSIVSPPSATGPAGPVLEGKVGGFYLLSLLANGEPRGLPGATIEAVSFQQAAFGYPLDDIVVHARNGDGTPAILEIQSKRSVTFTASDEAFQDVVRQILAAWRKEEFRTTRYELAVAIGKTTTRIEADCQEVLYWARELPDASTFKAHIGKEGFSSAGMRGFVSVFKENLKLAGAPEDDELVWQLLRRFQILVFDFQSHGADHAHQARERCRTVLAAEQAGRSGDLWAVLSNGAMQSAAAAGSKGRAVLADWLNKEHGFAFGTRADLRAMHARLKAEAQNALADIKHTIAGVRLSRTTSISDCLGALEGHKALAVTGAAGTGKSAVLKHLAQLQEVEGTILFLSRGRITASGGLAWAHAVNCALPVEELFNELACCCEATLFIDNIDQIDDPSQVTTINDLLRAAAANANWRIAFTAADTRAEWLTRFPALQTSTLATIEIAALDDAEAQQLTTANPGLFAILDPQHPARGLARNLFLLSRMIELAATDGTALSGIAKEIDLADTWWRYGGGRSEKNSVARRRLLRVMAAQIIAAPATPATRSDDLESARVEELIQFDSIREHQRNYSVTFRHDVLRDWTIGHLLHDDAAQIAKLPSYEPVPASLVRALEFSARLALDADDYGSRWLALLSTFQSPTSHGGWRRPVLLALTRSEHALALLEKVKAPLLADNGRLLAELLKLMQSVETEPLKALIKKLPAGTEIPAGAQDFLIPKGSGWDWLILWMAARAGELPHALIPDAARLFQSWLIMTQGRPTSWQGQVMQVIFDWLIRIDQSLAQTVVRSFSDIKDPDFTFPRMREVRDDMRVTFFTCCHLTPQLAEQYLKSLKPDDIRHTEADKILCNPGSLVKAAPAALADFALAVLIEEEDEDEPNRRRSDYGPFMVHEHTFSPCSPGQGPFLELLLNAPKDGLRLVRGIVEYTTQWCRAKYEDDKREFPGITVPFPGGARHFGGDARVYAFARSEMPSSITTSALMALEAWGHREIEAGRPFHDVMADIFGEDGSSIAFLAVAVDLALSHWGAAHKSAWPLLAVPELLRYDDWRYQHDISQGNRLRLRFKNEGATWKVRRADLDARFSREHSLWDRVGEFGVNGPNEDSKALQAALAAVNMRIAASNSADSDPIDGLKACAKRAWRVSDPANWHPVTVALQDGSTAERLQFQQDPEEVAHRETKAKAAQDNLANLSVRITTEKALFDASTSTPEIVAQALSWAKARLAAPPAVDDPNDRDEEFDRKWDERAVTMAAALAARDYVGDDREAVLQWALPVLNEAGTAERTENYRNPQIEYNNQAIATLGLVQLYIKATSVPLRDQILVLSTSRDPAVRNAIGKQFTSLMAAAPDFVRAIVRVMLTSAAFVREFDKEAAESGKAALAAEIASRLAREKAWLDAGGMEPAWPSVPDWVTRARRGIRIGGTQPIEEAEEPPIVQADEHALAQLAEYLVVLTVGGPPEWLIQLAVHLMAWTDAANGPHGHNTRDRDHRPDTWNGSFFDFLGVLSSGLPHAQVIPAFINPLAQFNEEAFCDCAADFLRGFDRATFATDTLKSDNPVAIREAIATRIKQLRTFGYLRREKKFSAEYHLADLVSAFFYHRTNLQLSNRPSFPSGCAGITQTVSTLVDLIVTAPSSGYLATAFLNVLDAAVLRDLLPLVARALTAWSRAYGVDTLFWHDRDIGPRACNWLDKILTAHAVAASDAALRATLSASLDIMVRSGVGEASQVERKLLQPSGSNGEQKS
ncbi:MAG: hypothetical protein ABL904_04830 [Hyphomicrobiaceae bacterium]